MSRMERIKNVSHLFYVYQENCSTEKNYHIKKGLTPFPWNIITRNNKIGDGVK